MRIRVIGVQEFRDRHGKLRRYYRRKGAPSVPISVELKGAALAAEVDRLDRMYMPLTPVAGTLRLLIEKYKGNSDHWNNKLRDRTRLDYDRVFNWLGASLDKPLTGYSTPVVAKLRDKAKEQKGFKFANQLVITLRKVFAYGVEQGDMKTNPCLEVTSVSRPADLPEANRPWEPWEAVALLEGLPIHLRAPIALAAYLGPREGDICRLSLSAYQSGLISFTASKNRRALELPVVDDLASVLDEYLVWRKASFEKRKRPDLSMTLFVTSRLTPWTEDGIRSSYATAKRKIELKGKINPGMTIHGARHTIGGILADAGYIKEDRKPFLGHGHEDMSEYYARRAKRRTKLLEMARVIEMAYRNAGGNVINMAENRNESVKPLG